MVLSTSWVVDCLWPSPVDDGTAGGLEPEGAGQRLPSTNRQDSRSTISGTRAVATIGGAGGESDAVDVWGAAGEALRECWIDRRPAVIPTRPKNAARHETSAESRADDEGRGSTRAVIVKRKVGLRPSVQRCQQSTKDICNRRKL